MPDCPRRVRRRNFLRAQGRLMRETAVEFSMAANPNPDLYIAGAQRDRSKVSRDSYRPCARIAPQPFQSQARMRRILQKLFVSVASGDLNLCRQRTV